MRGEEVESSGVECCVSLAGSGVALRVGEVVKGRGSIRRGGD